MITLESSLDITDVAQAKQFGPLGPLLFKTNPCYSRYRQKGPDHLYGRVLLAIVSHQRNGQHRSFNSCPSAGDLNHTPANCEICLFFPDQVILRIL